MSDQDQPAPGDAFEDPAHDDVRSLLAGARATEPPPPDVVARLDATLAELVEQRRAEAGRGTVVALRGRRVGRILVAAAAVVLIGAGGAGIVHNLQDDSTSGDSAASGVAADQQAQDGPRSDSGSASNGAEKSAPSPHQPQLDALGSASTASLRSAHFAHDAAVTMQALSAASAGADTAATRAPQPEVTPSDVPANPGGTKDDVNGSVGLAAPPVTATPQYDSRSTYAAAACAGPPVTEGVVLPAVLDGVPVALVFRPPTATAQLVEAWSCDGATLLASASVPH